MSRYPRNSVALAAGVAFACLCLTPAAAQTPGAPRTLGNNDGIFIDGTTFKVVPGRAKSDAAKQVEELGARPLGGSALIFRSGGRLYMVETPVLPARSSAAQNAAPADEERTDRIRIEYVAPKDPKHQKIYELVKERQALETFQKIFAPFRLPVDLLIMTVGCDGVSNAWYERKGRQPTVSLCYEYLQELWDGMPKETTPAGITPTDAIIGQLFFATGHEVGHAMFDIFDVPLFGSPEDAADRFSTYVILQFGGERALRLVRGAAYSYKDFIKNYKDKPKVTLPLAAFSSDHGAPEARFYNLLCTAYGYDAKVFADVVDQEYLPQSRAKKCRFEYKDLEFAMHEVFGSRVDTEMVKAVLNTRWLTDTGARPPGQ